MAYAAVVSLHQTLEQILPDTGHVIHPDACLPSNFESIQIALLEIVDHVTELLEQYRLLDEDQWCLETQSEHIVVLQEFDEEVQSICSEFEDQIRDSVYETEQIVRPCTSGMLCPVRQFQKLIHDLQPFAAELEFTIRVLKLGWKIESEKMEEGQKIESEEKDENVKVVVPLATTTSSTSEIRGEDIVVGIGEEAMKIKHLVLGEPSSRLEIISIVGMGGMGKTTLARTIYEDNLVSQHFDVRTWITVSQIYDARAVLLSLLDVGIQENRQHSNEELATKVYRSLKFRRYLIIIDDIWNTRVWDDIKKSLPEDCNGSRVVVTTRQTEVAVYANSCICNVPLMNEDTSWTLLEKKVFGRDNCPLELADIGMNISRKCHGLPLALVVIAGLLRANHTRPSWEIIANDVNSAMSMNDEHHVFQILSLSYDYLPHWLKPCLLYFGRFPEDTGISASNLVKIWMAEGFLEPRGCKNIEETAYECLEDLIRRNLVSARRKRRNGLPKKCFVHDLIREMCIKLSRDESNNYQGIFSPRNILFFSIRSALCFTNQSDMERYELLRVLDAVVEEKDEFHYPVSQVYELVQLRYLALYYPGDVTFKIPTNICTFIHLQTLVIRSAFEFNVYLPPEIWNMPKLRHLLVEKGVLDYDDNGAVAALPLQGLETLSQIQIKNTNAQILGRIPNIRKLSFLYFLTVHSSLMHFIEHLVHLHHLENLNLDATLVEDYHWRDSIFPVSLRKLTMKNVEIPWEYMARICGSLPNLEVLKLGSNACHGAVWETTEGFFLRLKMLEIEDSTLKMWVVESSSHFPRLEHLRLSYCKHLEELPWSMGEVDTLQSIEVTFSSTNVDEWANTIFEQQRDDGNEAFQIRRRVSGMGKSWSETRDYIRAFAELMMEKKT